MQFAGLMRQWRGFHTQLPISIDATNNVLTNKNRNVTASDIHEKMKSTFILLFCVVCGVCLGGAAAVVMSATIQTPAFYAGSLVGAVLALLFSPLFLMKVDHPSIFPAMVIAFVLAFPVAILSGLTRSPWSGITLTAISILSIYYHFLFRAASKDGDAIKRKRVYVVPLLCLTTAAVLAYTYDPLPDNISSLIEMMGDNNTAVHTAAGRKLLKYGKGPFLSGLQHPDPRVRNRAAHFLGLLGDPSVQNELIKASKDSDPHVRMWIAFSLGKIGNSEALPCLHELAADEQEIVRRQAKEAIDEVKNRSK